MARRAKPAAVAETEDIRKMIAGVPIEVWPLGDVILDPNNANVHDRRSVDAIKGSIAKFGQVEPLLIRKSTGILIAGEGRWIAMQELGYTHVEVRPLDVDATTAAMLSLTLNRTAELSHFDFENVAAQLKGFKADGHDLGVIGWADYELEPLLQGEWKPPGSNGEAANTKPEKDATPLLDRADELLAKWKVEPGQLWVIPSEATPHKAHRLLCGDCRQSGITVMLCPEGVQGAFTSPPYADQRKNQYGGVPADQYVGWWDAVQANVRGVLAGDGSFFMNINAHTEDAEKTVYVHELVVAMKRNWSWKYIDEFCWERVGMPGDAVKMGRFKNQWEPVFWFAPALRPKFRPESVKHATDSAILDQNYQPGLVRTQGTGRKAMGENRELGEGFAFPGNRIKATGSETVAHPAVFPASLPAFFMKAFSDPGDTWLDPFCGSGTSIVAAERERRLCRGVEIDPKACAVALERLADEGLEPRIS